ncbi:MAG: CvpA family protein [Bacteroidales bacterium]|nr:CvpA family protein [Bacteroidales bacterium]
MSTFDTIILILAVASFLIGMRKGLIRELSGLLCFAVGVYGAVHFSGYTEQFILERFDISGAGIISFCLTLAIIIVAVHFIASVIDKAIGMTILSVPNRLAGGIFCVIKNLFIASCIICAINYIIGDVIDFLGEDEHEKSVTYDYLKMLAKYIYPYLNMGVEHVKNVIS